MSIADKTLAEQVRQLEERAASAGEWERKAVTESRYVSALALIRDEWIQKCTDAESERDDWKAQAGAACVLAKVAERERDEWKGRAEAAEVALNAVFSEYDMASTTCDGKNAASLVVGWLLNNSRLDKLAAEPQTPERPQTPVEPTLVQPPNHPPCPKCGAHKTVWHGLVDSRLHFRCDGCEHKWTTVEPAKVRDIFAEPREGDRFRARGHERIINNRGGRLVVTNYVDGVDSLNAPTEEVWRRHATDIRPVETLAPAPSAPPVAPVAPPRLDEIVRRVRSEIMCECGHIEGRHDPADRNCEAGPPCPCKAFKAVTPVAPVPEGAKEAAKPAKHLDYVECDEHDKGAMNLLTVDGYKWLKIVPVGT